VADLNKVKQDLEAAKTEFETAAARRTPQYPQVHKGAPHVKSGPVGGESRPFSLTRALAGKMGHLDADQCKDDMHTLDLFRKSIQETNSGLTGLGSAQNTVLVPLCMDFLPAPVQESKSYLEYKSRAGAAVADDDLGEVNYVLRKSGFAPIRKDQSYIDSTLGGTLVPPPVMGDLIELIRPVEALISAGASVVPLPPNGSISYPRVTSAPSGYWVGENKSITESQAGTGQVTLTAKKVGSYVEAPNELFRFAAPAVDTMLRTEMAKSLTLALDYACFYGPGGPLQPKGLVNYNGTDQVVAFVDLLSGAPDGIGNDGNTLLPQHGYDMSGLIEDRFNDKFDGFGWVARPRMVNKILGFRADAVTTGDQAGAFVQSMFRLFNEKGGGEQWCGHKVTKSSVIRGSLTKGSGTGLTDFWGGIWPYYLLGMYGAVEIAVSNQAGSTFQNDQTAMRAILHCDGAPRHEGAFIYHTSLIMS